VTFFISHLKSLSEITLGAYMTFSIILIYGPYIALWETTASFEILSSFSAMDYFLSLGLGLTGSIVQISKNKALQYEEPAKLSVLMYFQSVIQLILDVIFLGTVFTAQQGWGISVILRGKRGKVGASN
jgi:drug/metabolite transporter (DMT)-like permease